MQYRSNSDDAIEYRQSMFYEDLFDHKTRVRQQQSDNNNSNQVYLGLSMSRMPSEVLGSLDRRQSAI